MLPADTLKLLIGTVEAASPQKRIVTTDREPANVYYVVGADGELKRTMAIRPPGRAHAADLESLAAWTKADDRADAVAWYNRTAIIGSNGAAAASDPRITFPLAPSPQMKQFMRWAELERPVVSQADMILLLRSTFEDCTPSHPQLLANVRKLRTTKASEVNSEIQKGKVSLGRSVVQEMSGMDLIPDVISFKVPVFDSAELKADATVRVCVDPDPEKEAFRLVVIPGQIEKAFAAGEEWLRLKLAELLGDGVPLYHGAP